MTTFVQLLSSGLALGAIYALIALGFVIIYRGSEVFNFAHGELLTIGAFFMVSLTGLGVPWGLALLVAMAGTGLLAATLERLLLRRFVGRPVYVSIILTIIIGHVLRAAMLLIWGGDQRGMPVPWETTATFEIGGAQILYNGLAAVVFGAVAMGVFVYVLRYTRLGLGMRASAADQEAALAVGIPVGRVLMLTWFIAGACAALAGIFLGTFPRAVEVNLSFVALRAFPAIIVGGLDSVGGTVIAGLGLGILEVMAQGYVNPLLGNFGQNLHEVFPYVIMILFLVVRPYGLFGRKDVERV
ncbi:MAG: branched-chain amino acid ABC transporter permease [Deltaproteobacteria bacterium]|nr:branched-chain amino acid ABC transporter permease [Deltaproteobacteria bacterium]